MTRKKIETKYLIETESQISFRRRCQSCWITFALVSIGVVCVSLVIYGLLMSLRLNPTSEELIDESETSQFIQTYSTEFDSNSLYENNNNNNDSNSNNNNNNANNNINTNNFHPSNQHNHLETSTFKSNDQCIDTKFDLFLLTVYWPSTYCSFNKCTKTPSNWLIHGLWPNFNNGSWPEYCCDIAYDQESIKSLLPRLDLEWEGLIDVEENTLWEHEWSKHGTCCYNNKQVGGQYKYFKGTLELFEKYPIQKWLQQSSITPKPTHYETKIFINSIESNFGKKVILQCKHDYLDSVMLCFNRNSLEPINCPEKTGESEKCHHKLIYPQI